MTALEHFEWENNWLESCEDTETTRVLYIGDSISCGVRIFATAAGENKLLFDGIGTSKGLDNPHFYDLIRHFACQQHSRAAVIFNNGLHGWHLDNAAYEVYYQMMIDFLKTEFSGSVCALVLTTDVINNPPGYDTVRIDERNIIAERLAEKNGLPVIDLYGVSHRLSDSYLGDGVHFTDKGYTELGKTVFNEVSRIITFGKEKSV